MVEAVVGVDVVFVVGCVVFGSGHWAPTIYIIIKKVLASGKSGASRSARFAPIPQCVTMKTNGDYGENSLVVRVCVYVGVCV